ncbi:MAG TPA: hypothetical protein VKI62_10185 [Bacteroidota bacterium]|nr:hypothetical protein [Bacteroidota bacterium]
MMKLTKEEKEHMLGNTQGPQWRCPTCQAPIDPDGAEIIIHHEDIKVVKYTCPKCPTIRLFTLDIIKR